MSQINLGEELGAGGAGTVYDGTWQGRRVAIKKLPGRFTRAADQEMELISKLRQENVVRYYAVEKSNTAVCLVMELISGGTLFDFIQREFGMANYWIISYKVLQDIATGMNYLHGQNIIHGDLKSHNILLRKDTNQAVICDFGLSKTLTTAQSHVTKKISVVQGTMRWLAPELCKPPPERLSRESDVWAFGCVILEITSGDLPWINRFEREDTLFFALQGNESRQGPTFAHECATQKAPAKIRELLCSCCAWSKQNRPNFPTIIQTLKNVSSNDLRDITQPNKTLPAPPTEALSRMSLRSRQEDDERRAREERERKERRDRSEEERRRRHEQDRRDDERRAEERRASQRQRPSSIRPVIDEEDLSDTDDSEGGGMRMPFGFGGGGMSSFSGFATPRSSFSAGLPPGAHYTGQLYSSRGSANGRPLIQGPRGGTFYITPSGNKRYV